MIRQRFLHFSLFPLILLVLGCCDATRDTVTIQSSSGEVVKVIVEIADSPEERSMGLMFRESLPEGTGMLFLFPAPTQGSFWMKNTSISLDILFVSQDKIVSIFENTIPFDETLLTPDSSYTMTLEVPGGYSAQHGIQVGDSLSYQPAN